jgi:hypothetical protein
VSGVSLSLSWFPVACPSGFLSSDNITTHLLIQSYWLCVIKRDSDIRTYRVPFI